MRTSSVEDSSEVWTHGSEQHALRLFGRHKPCRETTNAGKLPERGAILTAPVQEFYRSTEAVSELQTQSFAPIHLEPVPEQQTAVVRPFPLVSGACETESPPTLRTGQHPSLASDQFGHDATSGEYSAQDTIEMAPFWMAEPPPESESSGDASSAVVDPIPVRPILAIKGPTAQLRASELYEPDAVQMADTTYMEPWCVADHAIAEMHRSRPLSRAASDESIVQKQAFARPGLLARIGMFSIRRPLLVWLVGAILAFLLSATAAVVGKRLHRSVGIHQPVHGKSVANPQMPLVRRS